MSRHEKREVPGVDRHAAASDAVGGATTAINRAVASRQGTAPQLYASQIAPFALSAHAATQQQVVAANAKHSAAEHEDHFYLGALEVTLKTIDRDIAYWRKCAEDAPTKQAALVAIGVSMGLQMARTDIATSINESADTIAKWTASALAAGWTNEIHKIKDMDQWTRDIQMVLDLIMKRDV